MTIMQHLERGARCVQVQRELHTLRGDSPEFREIYQQHPGLREALLACRDYCQKAAPGSHTEWSVVQDPDDGTLGVLAIWRIDASIDEAFACEAAFDDWASAEPAVSPFVHRIFSVCAEPKA